MEVLTSILTYVYLDLDRLLKIINFDRIRNGSAYNLDYTGSPHKTQRHVADANTIRFILEDLRGVQDNLTLFF